VLPPAVERMCRMFTAEQYRAKAAEFRALLTNAPRSANETREFRDLEQTYMMLAENEEWMTVHIDKTIQRRKNYDNRTALAEEEEQILKCLGAAVLMRWNTVPTKLQRELFDYASTIGDLQQTTPLKGRIARFLHNHKNDRHESD
jgi:ferric-dicitrate binding protein FerR (iron transport regulator)